jgi:hypothetical protein
MPDPNTDMMTSFLNANYIRAEDLQENVLLEKIICEVKSKDFDEDGEVVTKPVIAFEDGSQLVLNQTRLRVLLGAYGPNANNWLGKTITISRGKTPYAGKPVPCVVIEPILAARIAAAKASEPPARISRRRKAAAPVETVAAATPIDDDIPF